MNSLQVPHPLSTKLHPMLNYWYYRMELKFTHFLRISVILLGRFQAISDLCIANVKAANKIKTLFCQFSLDLEMPIGRMGKFCTKL